MKLVLVFDVDAEITDEIVLSEPQKIVIDTIMNKVFNNGLKEENTSKNKIKFEEYFTTSDDTYEKMLEL